MRYLRMRTESAAFLAFSVVLLCGFVLSGCGSSQKETTTNQAAPTESGKAPAQSVNGQAAGVADRVDGTLTVNGNQVRLNQVYAWTSKGAFDESKTDVHILMTDRPVPEEKLKGSMPLMSGDGPQGVELRIDEDKKVIEGEIYHSALKHGYFSGTGMHVFEPVTFDKTAVEGKVRSDVPQEAFGDKWEYSVSIRAKVRSSR